MRTLTVIDPGHGGTVPAGRSTPCGVRAPNGLLEKDVTLQIARGVAQRLGGRARLTRAGDWNVTLGERARASGEHSAQAFVSIHASSTTHGARGAETWIHEGAGPQSLVLAELVRGELARVGAAGGDLQRGEIAILSPRLHAPEVGACLVEVDCLDDPEGAARLGDPRHLDGISAALARAVDRYHARRPSARPDPYGARAGAVALDEALDLTDFDAGQFSLVADDAPNKVPNNLTRAELDEMKRAWDCMNRGRGMRLQGLVRDFRRMLLDCMATSAVLRERFLALACDAANTVTFDLGRSQQGIRVDAFRFEASNADPAMRAGRFGFHTIDLDDFDKLPRVAGQMPLFKQTRSQKLIHALTEAREGVLNAAANAYDAAHQTAIDQENRYRDEQGMWGHRRYVDPQGINDWTYHLQRDAKDVLVETWHWDAARRLTSIDYTPA
jgi:N-acetylmuramoyl-L-alanine amidase